MVSNGPGGGNRQSREERRDKIDFEVMLFGRPLDPDDYFRWEKQIIRRHGFIIHHCEHGDERTPFGANVHTHGLEDRFGHHDFQIVLRVSQGTAGSMFHALVDRIKGGHLFSPGEIATDVFEYPVKFVEALECGREVLRLIIPNVRGDPSLALEEESMAGDYRRQYEMLRTHTLE